MLRAASGNYGNQSPMKKPKYYIARIKCAKIKSSLMFKSKPSGDVFWVKTFAFNYV